MELTHLLKEKCFQSASQSKSNSMVHTSDIPGASDMERWEMKVQAKSSLANINHTNKGL